MKIGIDARPLSYRLTGIGIYLTNLLETLQAIDHENWYYLISNGPIDYNLKNPRWFKAEGRHKHKLISTIWMQCQVPLLASKFDLDLFWGTRHNLPLLLSPKRRTVLTIHDVVHQLNPSSMSLTNFLIERLLSRWSVLKANHIISVSRSTASGIQKFYRVDSKKITVIYSGAPRLKEVTTNYSKDNLSISKKYFVFVGTLDPRKNFFRIFKAFEKIKPRRFDVHLVVIGEKGWKNKKFLKEVRQHPLNDYIHFLGYVNRDQLASFYSNALCLLFPSLYEGFGLPILEAMSCGTPVITSNRSSLPEVAGDAAILINPYDIGALAKAMREILTDERLREKLKKKGLNRTRKFSWEQCARQTLHVFNMIADGR